MGQAQFIVVDGVRIPRGPATKALEAQMAAEAAKQAPALEKAAPKKKKASVMSKVAEKVMKPKRARDEKGQLKADDPSTPDVNEAYEGGKGPESAGE